MTRARAAWLAVGLAAASACASIPIGLPAASGAPFPEFRAAFDEATSACRGIRTWTAEIGLSGSAGRTKIRGRLLAGFERGESVRLEAVAPFGRPVFILAAQHDAAILFLPRDNRVLHHMSASAIIEALTGIALGPDDLLRIFCGCLGPGEPQGGSQFGGGWYAVVLDGPATALLRRPGGAWRVEGGSLRGVGIEYRAFESGRPSRVRLRRPVPGAGPTPEIPTADLTLEISQVDINVDLPPNAFTVDVPADAVPLTLAELRDAGPLGVRR